MFAFVLNIFQIDWLEKLDFELQDLVTEVDIEDNRIYINE